MVSRLYPNPFDTAPKDTGLAGVLRGLDPDDPALHHILAVMRALIPRDQSPTREDVAIAVHTGRTWYDDDPRRPDGSLLLMTVPAASSQYGIADTTIYRWIRDERMCSYGTRPVLVNGSEVEQLREVMQPGRPNLPRPEPAPDPGPQPDAAPAADPDDLQQRYDTAIRDRDAARAEADQLRAQLDDVRATLTALLGRTTTPP